MVKRLMIIRIYKEDASFFKGLPGLSNPKKMKNLKNLVLGFDRKKLGPEITDSPSDRRMKEMMGMILGR